MSENGSGVVVTMFPLAFLMEDAADNRMLYDLYWSVGRYSE